MDERSRLPPLLRHKAYGQASEFVPDKLLREARRQKSLPDGRLPRVCVLDPDGDIVANLMARGQAQRNAVWACYHTTMYNFCRDNIECGIVGSVVGAPFAVLVAEELFASGCELLIHVTSSGQIVPSWRPPFFLLVEKALRDEGTSYHYLSAADFSYLRPELLDLLQGAFDALDTPVYRGVSWTTDAPFRETQTAISQAKARDIVAVEMEVAGLYAFAQARAKPVVCFAHVTNQMGDIEGDFEKGEAQGSQAALEIILATAKTWLAAQPVPA
jgi:uridine phosphorylase